MLLRSLSSCMGSGYIVGMIMHDVVVMLYYYNNMFIIVHVHSNVG